ncbi:MAG: 23S rRNA (uracil(1939)-C(5))-methyltransferase RlmD [Gammaproteobacteria bacterium]|nr:23S rRNA (uracil(1939)-C(5))-methyltransferase RlmD [Gammaproteobacteria bacterium]
MSNFFETNITDLSHEGRGIAHINGKTTFIHGALPGETVKAQYTNKRASFDEAKLVEVIQASPERVTPPCQHFGVCGGCSLQHMSPTLQIQYKQAILLNQFQHFGQVVPEQILAPLTGITEGYRRKGRLGVRYVRKKQRLLVGFREMANGRMLADIKQCEVLDPRVGHHIEDLAALISGLTHYDHIPQIEVAAGDDALALIIRHMVPLDETEHKQLCDFGQLHGFEMYLQPAGIDSIHKIWPDDGVSRLSYKIDDEKLEMRFHPTDFTQVNADINQKMIAQALALLDLQATDRVLDLFCGLGNFTLPMAKHCQHVTGIEVDAGMVKRGYENAAHNGLENIAFYSTNLMEDFTHAPWFKPIYDKVLIDPPRTGAEEIVTKIAALNVKRIVYVSCHPATLARDAGILAKQGYRLKAAGVMDMFPHTEHVESIALFECK